MRIRMSLLAAAACTMALSAPAWAKQLSTELDLMHPTKIDTAMLKPGEYRLEANAATGQVELLRDYRVVARVKGQWITTPKKAKYSEVVSNNNVVQEVTFAGKQMALKFSK